MINMNPKVFTIGHSNHPFSRFMELVQKQEVQMVVDVRTRPYSKYTPYYSKKPLEEGLKPHQPITLKTWIQYHPYKG